MQLETDANGNAVMQDGKPIIVYDDGRKAPLDFQHLIGQVKKVSDERDTFRSEAEKARENAKLYEGLTPEQVQAAKNLDAKKLVDAGKVDDLLKERLSAHVAETEKRLGEKDGAIAERDRLLDQLVISSAFATAPLDDYVLTPDLAEAAFAKHFRREGLNIVPYRRPPNGNGDQGEKLYSRTRPGEIADFREALSELLEAHPNRDKWKKSSQATGSGAPGNPNGNGHGKTIKRSEYEGLPHARRMELLKAGVKLTD